MYMLETENAVHMGYLVHDDERLQGLENKKHAQLEGETVQRMRTETMMRRCGRKYRNEAEQ